MTSFRDPKDFITPDLTPKEQESNNKLRLRAELKERNKNAWQPLSNKNRRIVQRKT